MLTCMLFASVVCLPKCLDSLAWLPMSLIPFVGGEGLGEAAGAFVQLEAEKRGVVVFFLFGGFVYTDAL